MLILGLAGPARVGKDTVAAYLVRRYGFVKFAFSDALYREVQVAFGLPDQSLLRDPTTKEAALDELALVNCYETGFIDLVEDLLLQMSRITLPEKEIPLSPRQVLQWWGTEYRRAQDPDYWVKQADAFVWGLKRCYTYPEHQPQLFVECGTRFENERKWIKGKGDGNIWHIHRDSIKENSSHESAKPLPVLESERELWNNDTIDRLYGGIDLLLSTTAKFVRVEPQMSHEELCREYAAAHANSGVT